MLIYYSFSFPPKNKKVRQPKPTHEKYIAPTVAKHNFTIQAMCVYAKQSICIFTEIKIHTLILNIFYKIMFGNFSLPLFLEKINKKIGGVFNPAIVMYYFLFSH